MLRRHPLLLAGIVLTSLGLAFGAFRVCSRISATHYATHADDLEWLRMEFGLNEEQITKIRRLHEGYLPQCRTYCRQIAEIRAELETALAAGTNRDSTIVREKLQGIAGIRAQCQAAMLRHFEEVSRAMPPDQAKRYLAEMERLTIGSHESIEASMSSGQGSSNAHDGHHHGH